MEINDALIEKLENLAKLSLSKEEKVIMKNDLSKILDMIDKIKEVDTKDVEPLMHIHSSHNVWREDLAKNQITNEEALKNAPSTDSPYLTTPKVIDL